MKQSHLFTKTRKEAPADEVSKNAQLLIRAGYIHKNAAGVYEFLPLGLRVMRNISEIVRQEMNRVGGIEMKMTVLQDPAPWKASDRWNDAAVDVWFKTRIGDSAEFGLGFTHEEPLTQLMREHIRSYRDLPAYPYQIQAKFRAETRAKSGLLRGREFVMKDLYSFSKDETEHRAFYEKIQQAYQNIYARVGIGDDTFLTFASGGSFAKFSHEFQTVTDAGEDVIYLDRSKKIAVNQEVLDDDVLAELGLSRDSLEQVKASEVGNIFTLGTRFSEPLDLLFEDEDGKRTPVVMGSYGIGIGRLMGIIAEMKSDDNGLVWPREVAPFAAHLISLGDAPEVTETALAVYQRLRNEGIDVLWDDRDARPGEKFAEADLLGMPYRLVVSEKSLAAGGIEFKGRTESDSKILNLDEVVIMLHT